MLAERVCHPGECHKQLRIAQTTHWMIPMNQDSVGAGCNSKTNLHFSAPNQQQDLHGRVLTSDILDIPVLEPETTRDVHSLELLEEQLWRLRKGTRLAQVRGILHRGNRTYSLRKGCVLAQLEKRGCVSRGFLKETNRSSAIELTFGLVSTSTAFERLLLQVRDRRQTTAARKSRARQSSSFGTRGEKGSQAYISQTCTRYPSETSNILSFKKPAIP